MYLVFTGGLVNNMRASLGNMLQGKISLLCNKHYVITKIPARVIYTSLNDDEYNF